MSRRGPGRRRPSWADDGTARRLRESYAADRCVCGHVRRSHTGASGSTGQCQECRPCGNYAKAGA